MNTQTKTLMPQHNSGICRILFASFFSALCLIALSTQAATITVTNTNDSGAGSLRQAVADVVNGDTIDFGVTGTITLMTGELLVNKNITLNGPGSDHLIVDGNHVSRVFHVSGGVTAIIAGLAITNGSASDWGGGIYNDQSVLTVNNCNIVGNFAPGWGGGIFNDSFVSSATLRVTNSTLSGNSANSTGGAIYSDGSYGNARLEIVNSTVSGNSAHVGGGIYNSHSASTISNCTLSGNSASYGGGGVFHVGINGSATLRVTNSTLSANSAPLGAGIYSYGHSSTMLEVIDSTLNANGIINVSATSQFGSTIFNASGMSNESGTINSLGYNLSNDDASGFLTASGDHINTDPMLGPLQDNGGPTFTHELLTGSPAIDAGDPNFIPPPDNDQRGPDFARVVNGRVDVGAFEVQTVTPRYAAQVQSPINADGTSAFNVRRGVVPVRFNLTINGVATCDQPPATITVTRTAGGAVGEVNESVYSGNADTGSSFRISNCQYIYNLNARALGVGTYRVDILINGQVVGSATFGLN
ncbi:MAG: choice-of-anchor Q domain-containing protein [Candidatus Udaeobacter sp.]